MFANRLGVNHQEPLEQILDLILSSDLAHNSFTSTYLGQTKVLAVEGPGWWSVAWSFRNKRVSLNLPDYFSVLWQLHLLQSRCSGAQSHSSPPHASASLVCCNVQFSYAFVNWRLLPAGAVRAWRAPSRGWGFIRCDETEQIQYFSPNFSSIATVFAVWPPDPVGILAQPCSKNKDTNRKYMVLWLVMMVSETLSGHFLSFPVKTIDHLMEKIMKR